MFRKRPVIKSDMIGSESYIGETIECKVRRILNNKEPITDGAPVIYTDRKDGVLPAYNIRTDRFELAVDAMDYVSKSKLAERAGVGKVVNMDGKDVTGGESIQGAGGEPTT